MSLIKEFEAWVGDEVPWEVGGGRVLCESELKEFDLLSSLLSMIFICWDEANNRILKPDFLGLSLNKSFYRAFGASILV